MYWMRYLIAQVIHKWNKYLGGFGELSPQPLLGLHVPIHEQQTAPTLAEVLNEVLYRVIHVVRPWPNLKPHMNASELSCYLQETWQ